MMNEDEIKKSKIRELYELSYKYKGLFKEHDLIYFENLINNSSLNDIENNKEFRQLYEKCIQEYVKNRTIFIEPSREHGFSCGYAIYIPDNCNTYTSLLVSCANAGRIQVENDNLEIAINHMKNSSLKFDSVKMMAEELNMPVLTPIIPRIRGYNTHSLSSMVQNCEINKINELREKYGIQQLNEYELDEIIRVTKDLPTQVINMIKNSKELLRQKEIIIGDKVVMHGYSAGSKFAMKFAELYPEYLKTLLIGGTTGLEPLNNNEFVNTTEKINILIQNGFKDTNDPAELLYKTDENGNKVGLGIACYPDNYTDAEVRQIKEKHGDTNQERFLVKQTLASRLSNVNYILHNNYGHELENKKEYLDNMISFVKNKNLAVVNADSLNNKRQEKINLLKQKKEKLKIIRAARGPKINKSVVSNKSKKLTMNNNQNSGFLNILFGSLFLIILTLLGIFLMMK